MNGQTLGDPISPSTESFADHRVQLNLAFGGGPDVPPSLVPDGHVLVLGDSRGNSRDSRYFGFVRTDTLYARALRVYFRSGQGLVWLPLSPPTD